jgi:hypothetical protein
MGYFQFIYLESKHIKIYYARIITDNQYVMRA